jgi:thiopurine S-methyltransferase
MSDPDLDYWQGRWTRGEVGFHEQGGNALLADHLHLFTPSSRVLVPLCGMAEDLRFLRDRGFKVCGVEWAREACVGFFDRQRLAHTVTPLGPFHVYRGGGIEIFQGDFFAASPALLGRFDSVFDRAALVALNPSVRARYAETVHALLNPKARMLLVTLEYDQSKTVGPPWSIDATIIRALFGRRYVIEPFQTRHGGHTPRLLAAGVESVSETLTRLTAL